MEVPGRSGCILGMTQFAIQRVTATEEAVELIEQLSERHGPLAFLVWGSFEQDSPLTCLSRAELLPDESDVKLGEIGGAPVYMDAMRYERAGRPALAVDVAPGAAGSLRLEGLENVHFLATSRAVSAVGR
jgi:uncharacterized protein